jgi:signal transduction histidine kinase
LARLTEQLIHSQEAERQRLSLEIHDGLGQTLGALKYVIENAIELLNRGDNDIALEGLSRGVTEIQVAIDDARSMATNLRPTLLDDLGPVAAIRWLCGRFAENYGSIEIILECDLPAEDFPPAIALHVFRIVQEALNNVAKHAQAQTVLVAIRKNRGAIQLIVRDDGSGFDPGLEIQNRHIGIAGMRHRARISGGEFLLTSNPESGTQISVAWGPAEDLN